MKAKSAYLLSKLDQMVGEAPPAPKGQGADSSRAAQARARGQDGSEAACHLQLLRQASRAPAAAAGRPIPRASRRRRRRRRLPPLRGHGIRSAEGYTIDEIRNASAGFFGQVSANLGAVIEHLFRKSGRPTGYVLGTEGGGAFLAGVRYGKGTLYCAAAARSKSSGTAPRVGVDVGGEGSKTLFLIYKLTAPEQLYASFTGIDGSAYLVGGVGATLVTNGTVLMAPIRSGLGLRLGANIGYIRFTPKATWNPF